MRARYTPPSTQLPNTIPTHPPPATRINSNSFLFSFEAVPVRGLIFLKTSHTWTVANDTRLFHHFHASYLTRSHFRKSPETYNFHVTVVVPTLKHANRYTDTFQPITAKVVSQSSSQLNLNPTGFVAAFQLLNILGIGVFLPAPLSFFKHFDRQFHEAALLSSLPLDWILSYKRGHLFLRHLRRFSIPFSSF